MALQASRRARRWAAGNLAPAHLCGAPGRRYVLLPRASPGYAWIDVAQVDARCWLSGWATGLRRSPLAAGVGLEHTPHVWPNFHSAYFACLDQIAASWRAWPGGGEVAEVRAWFRWLKEHEWDASLAHYAL